MYNFTFHKYRSLKSFFKIITIIEFCVKTGCINSVTEGVGDCFAEKKWEYFYNFLEKILAKSKRFHYNNSAWVFDTNP